MWVFICVFVSRGGVAVLATALHYGTLVALSCAKCVFGRGACALGWLRCCPTNQRLDLHALRTVQFINKVIAWCIIVWASIIAIYRHGPLDRYRGLCVELGPGLMLMVARRLRLVVMLEHVFGAMLSPLHARVPAHGAGRGGRVCAGDVGMCVRLERRLRAGPRGHPNNTRPKSNACVQSASCKPVVSSGVLPRAGPLPPPHRRSAVRR